MPRRPSLLLPFFCCSFLWHVSPAQGSGAGKDLYRRAIHYFLADNPTVYSDSLARLYFLQAIAVFEKVARR
ncbi:hypothetical protein ACQ86N_12400 [Puia sp. P3]|uniref:hypothetical protein n=1 Tax=Puia sp. P3 TaxID=3423952 RepID=UPI003D6764CA